MGTMHICGSTVGGGGSEAARSCVAFMEEMRERMESLVVFTPGARMHRRVECTRPRMTPAGRKQWERPAYSKHRE